MDIRQLRYFATVVEEGTISAAARKLHVSQPPLSAQMSALETEYGVRLFERGARQITLTEAGNLLFRYAQEILDLEKAVSEDLGNLKAGRRGSIKLGLISTCNCSEFFTGITRFRENCPEVQFKVTEGNTYQLLDQLRAGKLELAVIRTPYHGRDLEHRVIRQDSIVAAGTSEMLSTLPDKEMKLCDLGSSPVILYRRWETILRDNFEDEDAIANVICVADDARTAVQWALAGTGIALVPSSILPIAPGLEYRDLCEDNLKTSIHIVKRKDATLSDAAASLFESY